MLRMISYPHRPKSGHFTCYLNRTYHVLPTNQNLPLDSLPVFAISVLSGPLPLRGVTQHGYDVTEGTAILLQEPYFRYGKTRFACWYAVLLNSRCRFLPFAAPLRRAQPAIVVRGIVSKTGVPNDFIDCSQAAGD